MVEKQQPIGINKNLDKFQIGENNHDTIGIVAFDQFGKSAAGTTTNGTVHDRKLTIILSTIVLLRSELKKV